MRICWWTVVAQTFAFLAVQPARKDTVIPALKLFFSGDRSYATSFVCLSCVNISFYGRLEVCGFIHYFHSRTFPLASPSTANPLTTKIRLALRYNSERSVDLPARICNKTITYVTLVFTNDWSIPVTAFGLRRTEFKYNFIYRTLRLCFIRIRSYMPTRKYSL